MKPLLHMTSPEITEMMAAAADAVKEAIPPGTAFVLVVHDKPGLCHAISNVTDAADAPGLLRSVADRIDRNVSGTTGGGP